MFTQAMARAAMNAVIPMRSTATVTLNPDYSASLETVTCAGAWKKPVSSSLADAGHVNLQTDKTLIKIPDKSLNPAGQGRQIRARDLIVFGGETYRVTSAGSTVKTLLTVWECVCQKEMPNS